MDLRTLILARTNTVVLDPDRVASAATRPSRDADFDRFEDDLAQLGYVMSLDLTMTMRRLPHQAIEELRAWILATLGGLGAHPSVPLYRGFPDAPTYARRSLAWLAARRIQPCPWCARDRELGALSPCGHLVCRECWAGGTYAGCPVCHRRVAVDPFLAWDAASADALIGTDGKLRLLFLGFDMVGVARDRFERLIGSGEPLSADERHEVEAVIDELGPKVARWLPRAIARPETMAIAVARLWTVAPDRAAMARGTTAHLATATDVLRVAVVLMGGPPTLAEPLRLRSVSRGLRRAILDALDRLPADEVVDHVSRRRGLWKRVGERLHPFEEAARRPTATLAFAVARGTRLATATFAEAVQASATTVTTVRRVGDSLQLAAWAAPVEDGLRRGDTLLAIARLAQRPTQLLRRADHVLRVAAASAPATIPDVIAAIRTAIRRGEPRGLIGLAHHFAARADAPAIAVCEAIRGELVARAEARKLFPRAVIDRDLAPALWEIAAIHAAARANVIYVREPDGSFTTIRRRETEAALARLARLTDGPDDGKLAALPTTDAPTLGPSFELAALIGELAI